MWYLFCTTVSFQLICNGVIFVYSQVKMDERKQDVEKELLHLLHRKLSDEKSSDGEVVTSNAIN